MKVLLDIPKCVVRENKNVRVRVVNVMSACASEVSCISKVTAPPRPCQHQCWCWWPYIYKAETNAGPTELAFTLLYAPLLTHILLLLVFIASTVVYLFVTLLFFYFIWCL